MARQEYSKMALEYSIVHRARASGLRSRTVYRGYRSGRMGLRLAEGKDPLERVTRFDQ